MRDSRVPPRVDTNTRSGLRCYLVATSPRQYTSAVPRVILFKGKFQYGAVNVFVDELAKGLAALGRETILVDLAVSSDRSRLEEELSRPFEFIVAFAAIGTRPQHLPAGSHMYDRLSAPYVAVLVDHPSYQLDRFTIDNMIITCYDRTHVAFLNRYLEGRKRVEFLAHGGSAAGDDRPAPGPRPIGILFPGTYADPDAEYDSLRKSLPPDVYEIMDFVIERLITSDGEPMENALSAVLAAEGREDEWARFCPYLLPLESFVKPYKRMEVLRRLDGAGLEIEILGNHWPDSLFRHHRIQPARPYGDVLRLMQQSKMVLNMGFVPDGSHERVFSALLNGALPVSDCNPYLEETFPHASDTLLFRWTRLDELPARIAAWLNDEASLAGYPSRANELGRAHTWAARAGQLLELVRRSTPG